MNVCGVYLDDVVAAAAAAAADAAGCPRGLVIGTGIVESGGSATIVSPPDSNGLVNVGFLQLNLGGQGAGYTIGQLQDLQTNLAIGVPPLASAWRQYAPDLWTVLQAAGHPGWTTQPALGALWTQTPRADLGGRTPLAFIACAIEAVTPFTPGPQPPAQEVGPDNVYVPAAPSLSADGSTVLILAGAGALGFYLWRRERRSGVESRR